ncbi:hypothetical protein EVC12_269 [Rhizobium phage RHph_I42]|nr:hypothetical protein EVC12_269 [Rhizobium phage RHph_I42]
MTVQSQIAAGFLAAADAQRALRTLITGLATGDLSTLSTQDKSSIIAAINELEDRLTDLINDADAASLVSTYSAAKIEDRLVEFRNGILGGASAAYDTLIEIQNFLQGEDSQIAALLTAVGNKVDFAAAQSLTNAQQTQARSNIGAAAAADLATLASTVGGHTTTLASYGTRITNVETSAAASAQLLTDAAAFDYAAAFNTALNA